MVHRIDTEFATPGGLFTEGNPATSEPPTETTDDWLNDIQENIVQAVENAGITPTKGDYTQLSQAILAALPAQVPGYRNALINGGFEFWQRGTSFIQVGAGTVFTSDRWKLLLDVTAGSVTVSRQPLATNAFDLSGEKPRTRFFLKVDNSGGFTPSGSPDIGVLQRIESARTLAGRPATLSCKVKANQATTVQVELIQNFGTGGSPSAAVSMTPVSFNIGTSWEKIAATFAIPDVSGKTFGSNGDDFLTAHIFSSDDTGVIFDIAEVQLEEGVEASEFEVRPISIEESMCQRYFEKSYNRQVTPGTVTNTGAVYGAVPTGTGLRSCRDNFAVPKRSTPAVTWCSPATGDVDKVRIDSITADRSVASQTGEGEGTTGHPVLSASETNPTFRAHWTADAEL